jgi:hypothetical protein
MAFGIWDSGIAGDDTPEGKEVGVPASDGVQARCAPHGKRRRGGYNVD